ncbi:MAG: tetratricopeptide repeat protein [Vicinamibacteria bacterium]|nr:tetratricopeptide repeat protein [Vicinamibacteria bacterium]
MPFFCRKGSSLSSIALVLVLAFLASVSLGQTRPRDPAIAEGIALHDRGEFDKAIAKYQEALDRDPGSIDALYEMTYTWYAKRDLKKALELATRGAERATPLRPQFLMLLGNIQDDLENPKAAITAYQAAIKDAPRISLLHFNLGVTYLGQKEWRNARLSLQRDIGLDPAHASGHLRLAQAYQQEGFKVPAFLAYLRFLTLESAGPRAKFAADSVDQLMNAGYTTDGKGNVQVAVSLGSEALSKEEGDFGAAELIMQIAHAADEAQKKDPDRHGSLPESPAPVRILKSTLAMIGETSAEKGEGFAATYYVPFFTALSKDSKLLEAASYLVWQSREIPGVNSWLEENADAVKAFKAWSAAFQWSGPTPP